MKELSYKDTEREIEVKIYGLDFKINDSIEKINAEEIEEKAKSDDKIIEKIIDDILGKDACKKINEQRKKDGYEEMNIDIQTQVLNWIINQYTEEVLKPVKKTINNLEQNNRYYRRNKFKNRYRRY